jgi:2-keto-4-pentenoate hydratase/2-oxohepta-3-ene-1,7-dioic acid hydratase in catechol pathway
MTWALGTFIDDEGAQFPGLVLDEARVIDVSGWGWPSVRAILAGGEAAFRVLERVAQDPGGVPLEDLRVLPPVDPVHILQSGANYRRHVMDIIVAEERERGSMSDDEARAMGARIMDERAASGEPYIFLGATSAMVGAYDDIVLPGRGDQHDWELELVAVIGVGGRDIPREDALAHVAGYTIANDLTTRDLVYRPDLQAIGTDWLRAKNAPTFLPVGPWIVPTPFVADPMDLTITLRVDGQTMQDESTSDMIFDIATLVAYSSTLVELQPGDLVLTGSPAGNGMHHRRFLRPGDVIEGAITGLGVQRNRCVSASA